MERPIATLALDYARQNIGVVEEGENRGKAVEAYLASCKPPLPPGNPWCVAHVRFRLKQAATKLGKTYDESMPRTGYTPDYVAWAVENGHWVPWTTVEKDHDLVRPGDLCCFYFEVMGRHAHMGIFERWIDDMYFHTIEGNTSPPSGTVGVERDGDGLYRKKRILRQLGVKGGFIKLDF